MDVALNSASKLCEMLANGEVGCLELLTHYLDRVERLNGPVNAVVTLDREGAPARAAQAARARAGAWTGVRWGWISVGTAVGIWGGSGFVKRRLRVFNQSQRPCVA